MRRKLLLTLAPLLVVLAGRADRLRPVSAPGSAPLPAVTIGGMPNGYVLLNQGWRFRVGDNPAWAQPGFDDSGWRVVTPGGVDTGGLGYRWFRLRVRLPEESEPLGITIAGVLGTYQLYVNGLPAGTGFLPALKVRTNKIQLVPLPRGAREVELAFRIRTPASIYESSGNRSPIFGSAMGTLTALRNVDARWAGGLNLQYASSLGIDLLMVLAGLGVLALYRFQPGHREYLWLGLLLAVLGASDFALAGNLCALLPASANQLFGDPTDYLVIALQIEFTFAFAMQRITRPWRAYEILLMLSTMAAIPSNWLGAVPGNAYLAYEIAATTPGSVILPLLLLHWYRRGNREAGWLIVPSLFGLTGALFDLGTIADWLHWHGLTWLQGIFHIGPFGFRYIALSELYFLLAVGAVIFLRFNRVSRAEARAAAEMDAAREIQQTLVPLRLPAIERCEIAAAYVPAAEVGGDFYQVLPRTDGSAFIALGDVSGKGLRAAMTSSVAIGALRVLASSQAGPGKLLAAMNGQMIEAQQGGFVTMICARIAPGGNVTLANAGHLHPYRNGEEIELESGLPLGTAVGVEYPEKEIQLEPGDTLTFLSDGVVEARSASGELFGFERTRELIQQPAQTIADVAREFGQQDDITVMTVLRVGVRAEAATA